MLPRYKLQTYLKTREDQARMRWEEKQRDSSLQQTFTPFSLTYEMLERLPSLEGKDVLVISNMETFYLLKYLKVDGYVNFNSATLLTDIKELEGKQGVSYNSFNEVEEIDLGMKFDVVIGNPPYQDGNRKDQANKLWPLFAKKSSELLRKEGCFCLIHPNSWMNVHTSDAGKGKSGFKLYKDIMQKLDVLFLTINNGRLQSEFFSGIGSTFSYYVIRNSSTDTVTHIETYDGSIIKKNLKNIDDLPLYPSELSFNIFDKVKAKEKEGTFTLVDQIQGYYSNLTNEPSRTHTYKLYHTPAKGGTYKYANKPCPISEQFKVAISLSGKYAPKIETLGVTNMCITFATDKQEYATNALSILGSALYRYYVQSNKFSGFNPRATILKLPYLSVKRNWTDQEIYQYFNLTQEEIDLIESSVK